MVASPKRGSSLGRGFGRSMMKVLLLLVLFAGLLAAAPTKSGICTCSPAVKPKRDPTHPVASALKCVAKGSGGGDFADLSQPQRLGMGNRSSANTMKMELNTEEYNGGQSRGALKSPGKNRLFALTFACHGERTIAPRGA